MTTTDCAILARQFNADALDQIARNCEIASYVLYHNTDSPLEEARLFTALGNACRAMLKAAS